MTNRLIQFTLLISVNTRQREFNFRQRTPEEYDGNTTDERGERYYFKLVRSDDKWIFGKDPIPMWLREIEAHIGKAIEERVT